MLPWYHHSPPQSKYHLGSHANWEKTGSSQPLPPAALPPTVLVHYCLRVKVLECELNIGGKVRSHFHLFLSTQNPNCLVSCIFKRQSIKCPLTTLFFFFYSEWLPFVQLLTSQEMSPVLEAEIRLFAFSKQSLNLSLRLKERLCR